MGLFGNMLVDSPDRDYYSPANASRRSCSTTCSINADTLVPFGTEAPDYALMGRVGNVLLVNGEPRYTLRVQTRRGGALLPHQRRQLAHLQRLVRRRADESRRVRREPLRARGARAERGDRAGRALRGRRAVRQAGPLRAGQRASRRSITIAGEFEAEVDTLGVVTVDATRRRRRTTAARSRRCARNAAVSRDIDHYRPYFDKRAGQALTLTVRRQRAAARDGAVHEHRHGLLRARRVDRRHAGHELAVDEQAGALDPARRRDGQGEHGHRLARHARVGGEAADLQRSQVVPSDAASDPPARSAHARGRARRRADARIWCGRTPRSSRSDRRSTC